LSNAIFKDQTRVHLRARKVRQNGHKCHSAVPSLEKLLFSFTAAEQDMWPCQWVLQRHIAYQLTRRS